MKKNKKNMMAPTKTFLINVLYHVGFNKKSITKIANISSKDLEDQVIK
tara:strand:+ start:474 stop:617 length:144 start_codon:yes stop_codon:yes gene_type:complete